MYTKRNPCTASVAGDMKPLKIVKVLTALIVMSCGGCSTPSPWARECGKVDMLWHLHVLHDWKLNKLEVWSVGIFVKNHTGKALELSGLEGGVICDGELIKCKEVLLSQVESEPEWDPDVEPLEWNGRLDVDEKRFVKVRFVFHSPEPLIKARLTRLSLRMLWKDGGSTRSESAPVKWDIERE